jgi:hypothetical protein
VFLSEQPGREAERIFSGIFSAVLQLFFLAVTGKKDPRPVGPHSTFDRGGRIMVLLFMILLLLLLLALLPTWPYSRSWGYYPSGFATMLLIVIILMIVFGALDFNQPVTPS